MKKRLKKTIPFIIFSFIFFLIGTYYIVQNEIKQIKRDINLELINNTININSYFLNAEALIYSLQNTIEDKLNLDCCIHPSYSSYEYESKTNLMRIINFEGLKSIDLSSLTSSGNPTNYSKQKILEINSALHLKPIFNASIEVLPDLKWVYYTSKNNFIYIMPNYNYKNDTNLKHQYTLAFWKEAIPKNNPSRSLVITDLYEDGAGKGLLTTLSYPIYFNDIFKGVVSIDIGLNILNNLLPKDNLFGKTYLVNEKNKIVSSTTKFNLEDKILKNAKSDIEIEIITGQLKLLHKINSNELTKKAIYNSSGKIIIILLLILVTFIAIYLNIVLKKARYFASTDSLTNLLNRRAMQRDINTLINSSKRYNQELSFLLIDIDYFKKVNDKYGHQVGDKVLIRISKLFKENTRNCDIIARYGGEEFLIALSSTDINEAFILAERIRNSVQEIKVNNYDINLTISIGCTKLKKEDNFFSILKRVDKLLYKAKNNGRDRTIKDKEN